MSLTKNHTNAIRAATLSDNPLFDTPTAADYLRVSIPTMERWRRLGTGPDWVKMGGLVKYQKSSLDCYIHKCTRRSHQRNRHEKTTATV